MAIWDIAFLLEAGQDRQEVGRRPHLNPIELWDVGHPHQVGVGHALELHLNAHLRVSHDQLGIIVPGLQVEQTLQGCGPAGPSVHASYWTSHQESLRYTS